jgi:hypothetical protein
LKHCSEEVFLVFHLNWLLVELLTFRQLLFDSSDSQFLICKPFVERDIAVVNALAGIKHKKSQIRIYKCISCLLKHVLHYRFVKTAGRKVGFVKVSSTLKACGVNHTNRDAEKLGYVG